MSAGVHKYRRTGYSMVFSHPFSCIPYAFLLQSFSGEVMRLNGEIEGHFKSFAYCNANSL